MVKKMDMSSLLVFEGSTCSFDEYDAITNGFLEPYNTTRQGSAIERAFTSFWSTIKALRAVPYGIRKAFITGIAPLSLAGAGSGFNVAKNLSSSANAAGLCGLTGADIEAALKKVCGSDIDAYKTHLQDMTMHFERISFLQPQNARNCLQHGHVFGLP
jgi:hypothetical protein